MRSVLPRSSDSGTRALTFAGLLLVCGACALPQVVPEALSTEFKPTGEVVFRERTASFDGSRVRAPACNLSRRTDGSWGGTLGGRALDVSVTPTHVRGVDFVMARDQAEQGKLIITGQYLGRIFRFEVLNDRVVVRTPSNSLTLPGRIVSERGAAYGVMQELQLRGEAGVENQPWPQFGLALMAAFNSAGS